MLNHRKLEEYAVQLVGECFGTCVLILLGECAIANYKFAKTPSQSPFPVAVAFGTGVYSAMMIAGPLTGAHVNPAVSISLMIARKLKPLQCLFYVVGQILGAFLGAALVYLVFLNQFDQFDGGKRQMVGSNGTADIFFTLPGKNISHGNAFIDQVVSTALLIVFVMALSNKSNPMISEAAKPFAFVLIVTAITSAFSLNAGAAMNPARDLGPRLFAAFVYGWKDVFQIENQFFYIPIAGPILGGIAGVGIYQGYIWLVQHYGHSANPEEKNDDKDSDTKDQEPLQMKQKLSALEL